LYANSPVKKAIIATYIDNELQDYIDYYYYVYGEKTPIEVV